MRMPKVDTSVCVLFPIIHVWFSGLALAWLHKAAGTLNNLCVEHVRGLTLWYYGTLQIEVRDMGFPRSILDIIALHKVESTSFPQRLSVVLTSTTIYLQSSR